MFNLKLTNIFFAISYYCVLVTAKFPDDPKPCKHEDSDCLVKIINHFSHLEKGDSAIDLVPIEPLKVNKINIKQGAESPVNIDLTFTDNEIHGLSTGDVTKVKGFGKDPKGKHEIYVKFSRLSLVGDYSIKGKVLILPISGTGKSNMTMADVETIFKFQGDTYEKDGETYMKVSNMRIGFNPGRLYYYFGNLFNGDKQLGDNMNLFLNENWKDIFGEVKESLSEAFGQIFAAIVSKVFEKYPYNKYFLE